MNVLVVSNNDLFSRWVTFSLSTAGHRVDVMTPGGHRLTRLSRHCQAHTPCDADTLRRQDRSLLERIAAYCRDRDVQGVVPADLPASLLLSKAKDELKGLRVFPVSDPDLIERLHNKWDFFRLAGDLSLPVPKTWRLENREQAERAPLEFPVILKPIDGDGGNGVLRVESKAALSGMLEAYGAKWGWPFLAQKFIPGKDIDVSLLADHGRVVAWTVQLNHGGQQGLIEFCRHPQALETASALVRACGYHGVIHFDMRIDERTNRLLFIEANPRFWGSLRHSVWSGVNFAALGLSMANGEDVSSRFTPVTGPCRDPGFSIRPIVRAFLHGKRRPDGWSYATETGWRSHLGDPLPEVMNRLRQLSRKLPGLTLNGRPL
jgi:predicted ATP-grasp superfamily ATP-dependent carboligase